MNLKTLLWHFISRTFRGTSTRAAASVVAVAALMAGPLETNAGQVTFIRSIGGPNPGSGNGQFHGPVGIAVDPSNNVWVVDQNNARVEEFNNSGRFIRSVSTGGEPWGVAADSSGNVWVADMLNSRIMKYNSTGGLLTTVSGFYFPLDLAVDSSGDVWVADCNNHQIKEFNSSGSFMRAVGSSGTGNGQFSSPCGMNVDKSGHVWATDLWSNNPPSRLEEFSGTGAYLAQFSGGFNWARDVAVDSLGDIWIADAGNDSIEELDGSGRRILQITTADGLRFGHILNLAFDSSGDLWATDIGNSRVVEFSTVPEPSTFALLGVGVFVLLVCCCRRRR